MKAVKESDWWREPISKSKSDQDYLKVIEQFRNPLRNYNATVALEARYRRGWACSE